MSENVQKSNDKIENSAVKWENPIYATNWCDLPMEMRAECIKRMNFKTRTRLGATSHTEKSLVEAKKYQFDVVQVDYDNDIRFTVKACNKIQDSVIEKIEVKSYENHEKTLNLVLQLLKNCEIDTLRIADLDDLPARELFWTEIKKCAPFRFKTFKSCQSSCSFLENCEGVENIEVSVGGWGDAGDFRITDLLTIQAARRAKSIRITGNIEDSDDFQQLVQLWCDGNASVGSVFRFDGRAPDPFRSIGTVFETRMISEKAGELRIRTNDETKHLLLRSHETTTRRAARKHATPPPCAFSCAIIPSDLLESEYEKM